MTQQQMSTEIELMNDEQDSFLIADNAPPPAIIFNTSATTEIARFTEEGFYYKGEFIKDAGEVHRLLKIVLEGICHRQLCLELINELEDWIAYGDEADSADAHALVERARAELDT